MIYFVSDRRYYLFFFGWLKSSSTSGLAAVLLACQREDGLLEAVN